MFYTQEQLEVLVGSIVSTILEDGRPAAVVVAEAKDALIKIAKQNAYTRIDHSVDVRSEDDTVEAFNKFIKKWCGDYYPHLIDSDDNDGEFVRQKIRRELE